MPNGRNYGLLLEKELEQALNNKRYKNLSGNLQTMIKDMFGVVKPRDKIKCEKCEEFIKPDLLIKVKNKSKYVSVKSGGAQTVHQETIDKVIPFLRSIGIENDELRTMCLFHFADGTCDGSGVKRMDNMRVLVWLESKIKVFNQKVNNHPDLIELILERLLFQGVDPNAARVDYIYFGDLDYGITVSRHQIKRHLHTKSYMFLRNLHFGPILFRPHARYAHSEIKNFYNHKKVDFYWPGLEKDLQYIYKRYGNYYED